MHRRRSAPLACSSNIRSPEALHVCIQVLEKDSTESSPLHEVLGDVDPLQTLVSVKPNQPRRSSETPFPTQTPPGINYVPKALYGFATGRLLKPLHEPARPKRNEAWVAGLEQGRFGDVLRQLPSDFTGQMPGTPRLSGRRGRLQVIGACFCNGLCVSYHAYACLL